VPTDIPFFVLIHHFFSWQNRFLHSHHATEETMYFPWLEERLGLHTMDSNVAGHHAFEGPFSHFEELVASIRDGKATYDPIGFRKTVYAFIPPLFEHLAAEIDTLRPDNMRRIPEEEMWKMEKDIEDAIKKKDSLLDSPQFWRLNGDGKNGAW
jgi:hemerythrin-like domain-containing protein